MKRDGHPWTEEEISFLRIHWPTSQSATALGHILGRTKNAIIGKAFKEGILKYPKRQDPTIISLPNNKIYDTKTREIRERDLND